MGKDSLIRIGKKSFGLDNGMKRTKEECEAVSTAPGVRTINGAIFRRQFSGVSLDHSPGHVRARRCKHAHVENSLDSLGVITTWHVGA